VLVGVEVLFIDAAIGHTQFIEGGVHGTWTEFMLGLDTSVPLSGPLYLDVGGALGFGLGTGQQVEPPLDNAQVTDKGFFAQARVGADYRLGSMVSVGVTVPVTWGYLFKNGPGTAANDTDNHYTSLSAVPMLYVRLRFEPLRD
jgi:hypothetical protein